jgi:LysM repeat protein
VKGTVQEYRARACAGTLESMHLRIVLPLAAAASLAISSGTQAQADLRHTVTPGESLTSIAANDGVSIHALAGANRLAPDARLIAGSVLRIPPRGTGFSRPSPRRTTSAAPPASASHRYTVRRGDTLSALAARAGVSLAMLAALNHLHADGLLIAGATIELPGASPGAPAPVTTPTTTRYVIQAGDTLSGLAARAGVSEPHLAAINHLPVDALLIAGATLSLPGTVTASSAPPESTMTYVVQPGDTLTAIAARANTTWVALAGINQISPNALLLAGATLQVPASFSGPPYPTPDRVTLAQVEQIATAGGVPGALAAAVAWQESGFNNDLVSSADARGVMQILPGTWSWIQQALTPENPLAPASAPENVRGGVLLLRSLLDDTGGDMRLAIAGYNQGLDSVRRNGMFAVTSQYVTDVLALRRYFAGL